MHACAYGLFCSDRTQFHHRADTSRCANSSCRISSRLCRAADQRQCRGPLRRRSDTPGRSALRGSSATRTSTLPERGTPHRWTGDLGWTMAVSLFPSTLREADMTSTTEGRSQSSTDLYLKEGWEEPCCTEQIPSVCERKWLAPLCALSLSAL